MKTGHITPNLTCPFSSHFWLFSSHFCPFSSHFCAFSAQFLILLELSTQVSCGSIKMFLIYLIGNYRFKPILLLLCVYLLLPLVLLVPRRDLRQREAAAGRGAAPAPVDEALALAAFVLGDCVCCFC